MTYFLFLYSIMLTFMFGACGFGFLALYGKMRRKRDLWISILFFIYTCDNLVFSMSEMIPGFYDFYMRYVMTTPFPRNILTMGIIFSYLMIVTYALGRNPARREKLIILITALLLLVSTGYSGFKAGQFAFRAIVVFFHMYVFYIAYKGLFENKSKLSPGSYRFWVIVLSTAAISQFSGSAQCFYYISKFGILNANSRIIGHELFGLLWGGIAIWYLFRTLSRRERQLSEEELTNLFCTHYKLTSREADLVPMLLKGAQNSEICSELCIALNTVKVHTHNIYQKLGIERRSQLSSAYAKFVKSRN